MKYPKSIEILIESLKNLPGVGEKSAERLAFSIINFEDEKKEILANSILQIKEKIHECKNCGNLTDQELCLICSDKERISDTICVVETTRNINLFEKTGTFKGKYHVLNGLISPLDGVNPEDINLKKLIERIEKEKIREVILALKPSVEGETTAMYISKILTNKDLIISKIASGIPVGVDIEYLDSLTIELALDDRKKIN